MKRALILLLICAPLALAAGCAPKGKTQATAPKPAKAPLLQPVPASTGIEDKYTAGKKPVEDDSPLFVQPSGLYLRECPSKECKILATLPKGQQVKPLYYLPGWLEVSVEDKGLTGWLGSKHVAKSDGETPVLTPEAVSQETKPEAEEAPAQDAAQSTTPDATAASAAAEETSASTATAEAETAATAEQSTSPTKAPPPPKEEFSPGTKAPAVKTK